MVVKGKKQNVPAELEGSATISDVNALDERLIALEQKLSDPKQFATVFETAASDSKSLDKLFSKLFCDMMKNDPDVKAAVQVHVQQTDRDAVHSILKKWGGTMWTVFVLVVGLVLRELISWIGSWLPHVPK